MQRSTPLVTLDTAPVKLPASMSACVLHQCPAHAACPLHKPLTGAGRWSLCAGLCHVCRRGGVFQHAPGGLRPGLLCCRDHGNCQRCVAVMYVTPATVAWCPAKPLAAAVQHTSRLQQLQRSSSSSSTLHLGCHLAGADATLRPSCCAVLCAVSVLLLLLLQTRTMLTSCSQA